MPAADRALKAPVAVPCDVMTVAAGATAYGIVTMPAADYCLSRDAGLEAESSRRKLSKT